MARLIIDTSALVAIVYREDEGQKFLTAIAQVPRRLMSTANFLEAAIVVDRSADVRRAPAFDEIVKYLGIEFVPVTLEQASLARQAYRRYGKGNHPAGLNFGDCFAYALAKTTGETLLFKGSDFSHTDVTPELDG